MTDMTVGKLTHRAKVFTERHMLSQVYDELEDGWPVVVEKNDDSYLLFPRSIVGHSGTRRLVDLPLKKADPIDSNTKVIDAVNHFYTEDLRFAPVNLRGEIIGVVSDKSLFEYMIFEDASRRDYQVMENDAANFARVFDHIPDGVIMLNTDNSIQMTNSSGARILRMLTGSDSVEYLSAVGGIGVESLLLSCVEGRTNDVEIELEGKTLIFAVRILMPVLEIAPQTILILRDVTNLRERQSKNAWQERMMLLGQLAGGIAHDFNNLLMVISGHSSMLEANLPQDLQVMESLDAIDQTVDRASSMINQLLAFSRCEIVRPLDVDMTVMLKNLEELLRRLVGENILFQIEIVDELWPITADIVQIERVLANLVVNARNGMPEGGRLTIFAKNHYEKDNRRAVQLIVEDTGTGIDPEMESKIFDPYFTTDPRQGTGLGLATVYGTLQQLGGTISVRSKLGKGSRFEIRIPAADTDIMSIEDNKSAELSSTISLSDLRVLVVEDEEMVLKVTCLLLEGEGCIVSSATNMPQAIEHIQQHGSPDLVISDIVMPGGSGIDLVAYIREHLPDLCIILMTGHAHAEQLDAARNIEVPVLSKPFSLEQLCSTIAFAKEKLALMSTTC